MSVNELRQKAQQLNRKGRYAVVVSTVVAAGLCGWLGWGCLAYPAAFHDLGVSPAAMVTVRLGLGLLSLWSLYSGYKVYKALWPGATDSDADWKTTLHAYGQHLENRLDYSQNIWVKSGLVWCFAGIALVVTPELVQNIASPSRLLARLAPLFALLVLWLVIFIYRGRRNRTALRQEIAKLTLFEREHQA